MWEQGYGAISSDSLLSMNLSGSSGIITTGLIANSPQLFLSLLIVMYNGLFTCMLLANEYLDYAHKRKALRVTKPTGLQRSTYRLQLPYRFGVVLQVASGLLHWLLSQTFFLARVSSFDKDSQVDSNRSFSTIGYSDLGLISILCYGCILVGVVHIIGFRRFKPGMPLAGACSAAISAACHHPADDLYASTQPVMWGALQEDCVVGHCCFTSHKVSQPVEGNYYLGPFAGDTVSSSLHSR